MAGDCNYLFLSMSVIHRKYTYRERCTAYVTKENRYARGVD